ncbi:g3068 [Coccomyxa viridis]|uniref:G3068 protein n=1 Tax=Coccomyxa viridis TaxID=1274662 RepID=A0ABP1FTZ0_9CHLO
MATEVGMKPNGAHNGTKGGQYVDEPPRKFALPVDSEHKAKALNLLSLSRPHMLSFHLNWIGFFITFLAAYAAAPLIPIIRDSLNLEQHEANIAGVVTTASTVFARIFIGVVCDRFGPRYAYSFLLAACAVPVFCMAVVETPVGYIIERLFIGCSLAAFVVCQFWSSIMFSPTVVGLSNAVAGGWGNAGGGVTQIVMPYMTEGIAKHVPEYEAWRWAFFLPGCLYIVITFLILTLGQDCPDGNYASLERSGKKQKSKPWRELYNGFCNYRMWGLAACYAYSFGVELALDNALAPFFENNFGFGITKAANLAAIFGMMNFFARPLSGLFSDLIARRYGMRGRLWWLWFVVAGGGVFTVLIGVAHEDFAACMCMMILAGIFLEAGCGATYGVVPFVSRRSTGIVCGLVSAGGACGGVINQALFFLNTPAKGAYVLAPYNSFKWMGCVICFVAMVGVAPIYFPMWGGLICGPKKGYTEEDYYFSEYTPAEREAGHHLASSKFAFETRSQRGMKRLQADPMFPVSGHRVEGGAPANGNAKTATV